MNKIQRHTARCARRRAEIVLGSTCQAITQGYDLLVNGTQTPGDSVGRVIFDAANSAPADLTRSNKADHQIPRDIYVPAHKPQDRLSMEQAVDEGLVQSFEETLAQNEVPDNDGAGGIPLDGLQRILIKASVLCYRLCQRMAEVLSYEGKLASATRGDNANHQHIRVTIIIMTSAVGGMGNGGLVWCLLEGIRLCARISKVEVKVILELLSLGSLQTHHSAQARMNQFLCFKFIRELAAGTYLEAVTQQILAAPFDQVRIYSNRNNSGMIGSLKELAHHQMQLHRHMNDTPAGADMHERVPDISHWPYGRFEDPQCVYTASVAVIHWNRGRLLEAMAYGAAELLAREFLTEADPEETIRQTAAWAAANSLIESDDENQLTTTVSHPAALGGQSVYAAAEQSLIAPLAGTRGIERGIQWAERTPLVRDEVHSLYVPQMREKAQETVEEVAESLNRRLDQMLRQPHGLARAITFVQAVESTLDRSGHALAAKTSNMQEFRTSHDHAFTEAEEQFQETAEQGRIRRSLSFQAVRALNSVLEDSGRALISYELQIAACTVATEEVIVPLRDVIEGKLAELLAVRQNLSELIPHCANMVHHKANERTLHDPAVGLELVTREYVQTRFDEYLRRSGTQDAVAQWRSRFLQEHESLGALVGASTSQMELCLLAVCRTAFEPALENTDVLAEFGKVYPDEVTRRGIVAELIGESEGRLPVEGELNKHVAWVKTANVPAEDQADNMRCLLEGIDPKAGKWQVAVNPADPETFSIAQLRGEISLTPLINGLGIKDDYQTWRQLVERAADPVSALAVGPNPTPRQFRRVLAKAIAAGLLNVNADGHFTFRDFTGEELVLGNDAEAVFQELQPRFRRLVFIESYFASELVDSEPQIVARLTEMKAQLQAGSDDTLLGLIDATGVLESLQQAELLRPWAKRIQKRRKTTRHEA